MESIMGKHEFLSELEKSLSVLQEDELRDIISEYEQHIDIKVEKGGSHCGFWQPCGADRRDSGSIPCEGGLCCRQRKKQGG